MFRAIVIFATLALAFTAHATSGSCDSKLTEAGGPTVGRHVLIKDGRYNTLRTKVFSVSKVTDDGTIYLNEFYYRSITSGGINHIRTSSPLLVGHEVDSLTLPNGKVIRSGDMVEVRSRARVVEEIKHIEVGRVFSDGTLWLTDFWAPSWDYVNLHGATPFISAKSTYIVRIHTNIP